MTKTQKPKRQFCHKCLAVAVPVVTLTFGPDRRLHWCQDCISDADGYRQQAD